MTDELRLPAPLTHRVGQAWTGDCLILSDLRKKSVLSANASAGAADQ
jgi:hypothetical protein